MYCGVNNSARAPKTTLVKSRMISNGGFVEIRRHGLGGRSWPTAAGLEWRTTQQIRSSAQDDVEERKGREADLRGEADRTGQ